MTLLGIKGSLSEDAASRHFVHRVGVCRSMHMQEEPIAQGDTFQISGDEIHHRGLHANFTKGTNCLNCLVESRED